MQPKFIPVDFAKQILPGSFEHALHVLIDDELDLSPFSAALKNDLTGAPAYHPGVLLKIVLFAYSRGIISSRRIEAACRDHIIFIALSGDSQPHFSTIAAFVADHGKAITNVFTQVLMVCDRQGLIGRDMFAIDGVKLPSNAAKAKSGRRAGFEREAAKIASAGVWLGSLHINLCIHAVMLARPRYSIGFDRSAPESLAYYDVPAKTRLNYGLAFLALAAYLAVMAGEVHEMLEATGGRGRL